MTIGEHVSHFAGRPVVEFDPAAATADAASLADAAGAQDVTSASGPSDAPDGLGAGGVAWRLSTDYDGGAAAFEERLAALLATPWAGEIRALVIGDWGESYDTVFPMERFVEAAGVLTGLTALFVGEMTYEENEISWIQSTDLTPLLKAYPALEILRARGGEGLSVEPGRYPVLRELAFEAGGLGADTVRAVAESEFARLKHLELWLGTANYGGTATVEDLGPILSGARLPVLDYLGVRDSEIVDAVAAALAGAPVVGRIGTLDLSLGMLSDTGAGALLAGQPLTHLRRLDLHHHFLSEAMQERLRDELEPAGVELDLSDPNNADDEDRRFIAVSE